MTGSSQETGYGYCERSPILKEMEDQGKVKIVGAMLDVTSGKVTWD